MKRTIMALLATVSLALTLGCSNWSRATPAGMDDAAMKTEIKKNLAGDGMTGIGVDVNKGVVTLTGGVAADKHQTAVNDARKVKGVTQVVDNLNNQ
jgi:osmotically-inducible protein OsmY